MQKALTNKTLEALKPQTKRYEVHDLHCPALSSSGIPTFALALLGCWTAIPATARVSSAFGSARA